MDKFLKKYGTEGISIVLEELVEHMSWTDKSHRSHVFRQYIEELSDDLKAALTEHAESKKNAVNLSDDSRAVLERLLCNEEERIEDYYHHGTFDEEMTFGSCVEIDKLREEAGLPLLFRVLAGDKTYSEMQMTFLDAFKKENKLK